MCCDYGVDFCTFEKLLLVILGADNKESSFSKVNDEGIEPEVKFSSAN